MPTKKQQRQRAKTKRHNYEYVYVDADGNELDAPPTAAPKVAGATKAKASPSGRGQRREPKPPSWIRALKWAGIYAALFAAITIPSAKNHSRVAPAVFSVLLMGLIAVPAVYMMHRLQYRTYHRLRDKQAAPAKKS